MLKVLLSTAAAEVFHEETFDSGLDRWVTSTWKGGNGPAGTWDHTSGQWFGDEKEAKGMATTKDFHYHSATSKLAKAFSSKGKDLVVQFTAKHEKKDTSFCGGGYVKLMGSDVDQATFGGDSPYKIMFGPDLCGYDVSRIHSIFNFDGENLLRTEDVKLEYDDKNQFTHLYTMHVKADNTYEIFFDKKSKNKGSIHDDWKFPQKTKDDPTDSKPSDWVEEAKIDDPAETKPADWATEAKVKDPSATKPEGWDDDEDGEWEAPVIDNPEYKGAWFANRIDNPAYKGVWKANQIANEDFVENVHGYDDIGMVGFELWTVNAGSIFDNILLTDSLDEAWTHADAHWAKIQEGEKDAKEAWDKANAPPAPEGGEGGDDEALDDEDADAAIDDEDEDL